MIRQAVRIPITDKTQVTCGGYTVQQGGIGAGSLYLSSQHNVSPTHWLGTLLELGHKSKLAFSCGTSDDSDSSNAPRSLQVTNTTEQQRKKSSLSRLVSDSSEAIGDKHRTGPFANMIEAK